MTDETTETGTCPTCSTDLMSVADADLGDAMLVAIVLGNLQKCGTGQDIQDLLARDPAAGEWSLLDEIHESTGLEVPQKQ